MKLRHAAALALCLAVLFAASFTGGSTALAGDADLLAAENEALEVVNEYGSEIIELPGVTGIGPCAQPDGAVAIQIRVCKMTPEVEAIPLVLGGLPVVFDIGPPCPVEKHYASSILDAAAKAHAKYDRFLESLCDVNGQNCGQSSQSTEGWVDIMRNTPLPALPSGSQVTNIGYGDNGTDPTTVITTIGFMCPGRCTPPSGYHSVAAYVQAQVLTATNSVGFSVQSAMQSFGFSTALKMNQVADFPNALTQPSGPAIQSCQAR